LHKIAIGRVNDVRQATEFETVARKKLVCFRKAPGTGIKRFEENFGVDDSHLIERVDAAGQDKPLGALQVKFQQIERATLRSRSNQSEFRGSIGRSELEASERLISKRASPLRSDEAAETIEIRGLPSYFARSFNARSRNRFDQDNELQSVQTQERIGERSTIRTRIDDVAIIQPRQVAEIPKGAAILPVKKRPEFLSKSTHRSYIARRATGMKCLATYRDRQMLPP
jgi:hypothetical protein